MKKIIFAIVFGAIAIGAYCIFQHRVNKVAEAMGGMELPDLVKVRETPEQKLTRWRMEAQASMLKNCTNAVVGIHRIIEVKINSTDPQPMNWNGNAVVDYVNRFGGIERTNLNFKFHAIFGMVSSIVSN